MRPRQRWVAIAIAVPGIVVCSLAVLSFFGSIRANALTGGEQPFFQEHYQALSHAYSQAFAVGFFLCFFLTLAGLAVSARFDSRRGGLR